MTVKSAEARRATYRERLQRLDSRLRGLRLRKRPSEVLRAQRVVLQVELGLDQNPPPARTSSAELKRRAQLAGES